MFFKNSYYLNLYFFYVFYVFKIIKKKLETKYVFYVFLVLLIFENKKQFLKTVNKQALTFSYVFLIHSLIVPHKILEWYLRWRSSPTYQADVLG